MAKGKVATIPPKPADDEQVVTLDLSVEEFAILEHLRWHYLGGSSVARSSIDSSFWSVVCDLSKTNRDRVVRSRRPGGKTYMVADVVTEEFLSA